MVSFQSIRSWLRSHRAVFSLLGQWCHPRPRCHPQRQLPAWHSPGPHCAPTPLWDPLSVLSLLSPSGEPETSAQRQGGTRGASQRSADAFSARLYPALPRRTQSSKHREGIKPELGAPGASRAAGTSNLGPEVASLMGNVPKERQGPPGYRGRGKGAVCEGAHLWVRAHDGGRNLRGKGE